MEHPLLTFLFHYLSDLNVPYAIVDGKGLTLSDLDKGLRNSTLKLKAQQTALITHLEPDTIYQVIDYFNCNYSFFQFPEDGKFLFIGPYLLQTISDSDICEVMSSLSIPGELFPQLKDYYYDLPYIQDRRSFFLLQRHVYQGLFSCADSHMYKLDLTLLETTEEFLQNHEYQISDDPILSMKLSENRYHMEDDLLEAVKSGNTAKALSLSQALGSVHLPLRSGSQLRDNKNYMLSFNTLLRRTAYTAGVHPFYIDAVSSNFARMIEQCQSIKEGEEIVPYMVRSYCNLVEKHSTSSFSAPVRHILVTVDASLTADLSLKRFASELFLNTSYLSALFKKEVGMTLTDYVNKNRIAYAKKLLKSTTLSVQNIAVQSGFSDIHYFTRLFRRETGMSPRDFRTS